GVEPGDEDVRAHAVVEEQVGDGDVGDVGRDVAAAGGTDLEGRLADEPEDDRDVVGGEAPQGVLLAPHLPEAEAVGVDVADPPQLPVVDEAFERGDGGVVLEHVPNHQHALAAPGGVDEPGAVVEGQGQGFLDEDVEAGGQRLRGDPEVRLGRRRDRDAV